MLYLNEEHLLELGVDWDACVRAIADSSLAVNDNDYAQPVKPYLRYRNLVNRIIAMPAYVGRSTNVSGIKWIASFPENIDKGIKRANSVTILNEADTGVPFCIINTSFVSAIRTAAVSGLLVKNFLERQNKQEKFTVGMTGFGPIAKTHIDMIIALLGDKLDTINVFDLREIDEEQIDSKIKDKIQIKNSWQEVYCDADIFLTCTVSKDRYVDIEPKKGSLQLNVSLRDFKPDVLPYIDMMLVDDWEEICRENTDIEIMHKEKNLQEKDCYHIGQIVADRLIENSSTDKTIMFNPMGMAIFDMAIAKLYYTVAKEKSIGVELPD